MRYPCAYRVEGQEFKDFEDLDDDKALKLVALIYNIKQETWEDGVARSIALEEYQALLAKRRSEYIKKSGIFDIEYDKVTLSKWKDCDLMRLYDCLDCKSGSYYEDRAGELTEQQNAVRITCLTAMNAVTKEAKKRSSTRTVISVAGQVLATAATVALSFI